MTTARQPRMTAEAARSFGGFSAWNAAQAIAQLQERKACDGVCEPYEDVFTFGRWIAQGFAVRKGEHGAKIVTFQRREYTDDDGEEGVYTRPWATTVFCRHQVKPLAAKDGAA